jgi:hypothetical protein
MIDDTRDDGGPAIEGNLAVEVLELLQFRTDRNDAYGWSKDLKLLAFDGTDSQGRGLQQGQPTVCTQCSAATALLDEPAETASQPLWSCDRCGRLCRLDGRFHCNLCSNGNYDLCEQCVAGGSRCKDASHQLSFVGAICEHLARNSCHQCLLTEPFPSSSCVRSFRLVHQSWLHHPELECTHFVAVSYCWPQNLADQCEGRYTIRSMDGKIRRNRAPEKIIDRAVALARESGCRFIWIDQVRKSPPNHGRHRAINIRKRNASIKMILRRKSLQLHQWT